MIREEGEVLIKVDGLLVHLVEEATRSVEISAKEDGKVKKVDIRQTNLRGKANDTFTKAVKHFHKSITVTRTDNKENIINEWALPANSLFVGVNGSHILIPSGDGALGIDTNGEIHRKEKPQNPLQIFQCPETVANILGDSEYKQCASVQDMTTKEIRHFIYNYPCT